MTDTVIAKLAEWEALTEEATEGPWVSAPGDEWVHAPHLVEQDEATEVADVFDFRRDAEFIAAAREMVPALIAAVKDVLAACEKAKANPAEDGSMKVHTAVIEQALTKRIGGEG